MPTSHDTPFFEHAANHTGKPVVPTPPVYAPERTIQTIVNLATNPQDEVMVGGYAKSRFEIQAASSPYTDDMFSVRVRLMYLY